MFSHKIRTQIKTEPFWKEKYKIAPKIEKCFSSQMGSVRLTRLKKTIEKTNTQTNNLYQNKHRVP